MIISISSLKTFLVCVSFFGLIFGLWSAFDPGKSIGLYQQIMAFFNWRVEPLNLKRELITTRILGVTMALLSLAIFLVLRCSGGMCPLRG